MLLIAEEFLDDILRFKAPRGQQYFVTAIAMVNLLAVNNVFSFVIDFLSEDQQTDSLIRSAPFLAGIVTTVSGHNIVIQDINHKTKFLTIGKNSTTAVRVFVSIYGKLIPISRTDALIEWFRKGR